MMKAEATKQVTQQKSHVLFSRQADAPASVTKPVMRDEPPSDDVRARIAARAYQLYLERGCREGGAEQDWLEAEQDILGRSVST
jgi:hypothetical protein